MMAVVMMTGFSHAQDAVYAWLVLGCWLAVLVIGSRYLLSGAGPRVRRIASALLIAVVVSGLYAAESDARIAFKMWGWFTTLCVC
jgi:hypothetical protein